MAMATKMPSYGKLMGTGGQGFGGGGTTKEYEAARRANELRYAQMMDIYNKIIARAQPGGVFEKAGLAQIETAKTRGVGQEMQQMISSGMYGTTTAAGVERGWEAGVGAPARLRLEDIMEQRLTQAQLGKAGAIERREDIYPNISAIAQYAGQAAAGGGAPTTIGLTGTTQRWGTYGAPAHITTPRRTRKPGAGYYGDY